MSRRTLLVRPQKTDWLGRVIPQIALTDIVSNVPQSPREVTELLAIACHHGRRREYNLLVAWAHAHGITMGPADLAGHRSPICRW
jgi:hypothetical protein